MIGTIISSGKATAHQLDTTMGLEDAYDILEVILIDAHNKRAMTPKQE